MKEIQEGELEGGHRQAGHMGDLSPYTTTTNAGSPTKTFAQLPARLSTQMVYDHMRQSNAAAKPTEQSNYDDLADEIITANNMTEQEGTLNKNTSRPIVSINH